MKRLIIYLLIFLTLALSACSGTGSEPAVIQESATPSPAPTEDATEKPQLTGAESCPITEPPTPAFVPPKPYPETPPGGSFWYGTNNLWTDVQNNGIWHSLPKSDVGYGNKIALWHEGYSQAAEPEPEITLSARQLDGNAVVEPHLHGTNAYHPDYGQFMMTGIELPASGCWEITAEYRKTTLAFVVWVAP